MGQNVCCQPSLAFIKAAHSAMMIHSASIKVMTGLLLCQVRQVPLPEQGVVLRSEYCDKRVFVHNKLILRLGAELATDFASGRLKLDDGACSAAQDIVAVSNAAMQHQLLHHTCTCHI